MAALLKGILSVQSQVVYGHVGNAVAGFALRTLGHDVWDLPTVVFSNHPGHEAFAGKASATTDLRVLLGGLKARGVMGALTATLSGYLGDVSHVDLVAEAVTEMRGASPGAPYCCDPVMGDTDKGTYVKPGLPDAIRNRLVPFADILRPNIYELGLLTGRTVTDPESAIDAARSLPPPLTVCTSVPLPDDPAVIGALAVTDTKAWLVKTPRLAKPPPGTGDLFTALFLGHYLNGAPPQGALAQATSGLTHLLAHPSAQDTDPLELPLIDARDALVSSGTLPVHEL